MGDFETGAGWTAHESELQAIVTALHRLTKPCEIRLYSAHGFFATTVENMWIMKWQQAGWLNSQNKTVENRALYEEILNLTECGGHSIIKIDQNLGEYAEWLKKEVFKHAESYKKELEAAN